MICMKAIYIRFVFHNSRRTDMIAVACNSNIGHRCRLYSALNII